MASVSVRQHQLQHHCPVVDRLSVCQSRDRANSQASLFIIIGTENEANDGCRIQTALVREFQWAAEYTVAHANSAWLVKRSVQPVIFTQF